MEELTIEQKAKAYDEAIERIREWSETKNGYYMPKELCEEIFPELCESKDGRVRKAMIDFFKHEREEGITVLHYGVNIERMIAWLEKQTSNADNANKEYWRGYCEGKQVILDKYAELEKQCEQKPAENLIETWKDMRLEVYQQASGNRHEPNCSDDTTKMFSLNDIDEIVEKMSEQKPAYMEK